MSQTRVSEVCTTHFADVAAYSWPNSKTKIDNTETYNETWFYGYSGNLKFPEILSVRGLDADSLKKSEFRATSKFYQKHISYWLNTCRTSWQNIRARTCFIDCRQTNWAKNHQFAGLTIFTPNSRKHAKRLNCYWNGGLIVPPAATFTCWGLPAGSRLPFVI